MSRNLDMAGVVGEIWRQFAWLDRFGEKWLLLDGNVKYPARSWATRKMALAELKEEGWTIQPLMKPVPRGMRRRSARGYAMVRTIH